MSELSKLCLQSSRLRAGFLSNTSLLVLLAAVATAPAVAGDTTDRPTIWIELGGQLERQTGQTSPFVQPFVTNNSGSPAFDGASPVKQQNLPPFANGGEGTLSFEPNGTDWVFSASVRYGRSSGEKNASNETNPPRLKAKLPPTYYSTQVRYYYTTPHVGNFSSTVVKQHQSHAVLDFQAGKDVGLGFLGRGATSTFSAGVRLAQFSSRTSVTIHAIPDARIINEFGPYLAGRGYYFPGQVHHSYSATGAAWRNFRGVGPSLSWKMSAPVLGSESSAVLAFDGGMNASLLFGRQKTKESHSTAGYYPHGCNCTHPPTYVHGGNVARSRSVTIPNVGGFAGVSLKFPNAKISLGYRGDFFIGAMDTGIDSRKTSTVGFYGPYASISIGLGG